MEKSIRVRFMEAVRDALLEELASRRQKDPSVNQVAKEFNIAGVLAKVGATNTELVLRQGKGFTFLAAKATDGAFYDELPPFGQRRAMTQEEYDSIGDLKLAEAKAVAGYFVSTTPEGDTKTQTSFKWDRLFAEDGTVYIPSGPIRKYHSDTDEYDSPIYEESEESDNADAE